MNQRPPLVTGLRVDSRDDVLLRPLRVSGCRLLWSALQRMGVWWEIVEQPSTHRQQRGRLLNEALAEQQAGCVYTCLFA